MDYFQKLGDKRCFIKLGDKKGFIKQKLLKRDRFEGGVLVKMRGTS